jgi:predicted dehydrogenase
VEIVAYVDSDVASLRALQEHVPAAREASFTTLEEAIAVTHPQAMLVTTSLASHGPLVAAAVEAGLHVIVEKPFVRGVAAAEEHVAAAAAGGVILMVSQNYRFFPAPRVVERLMRELTLGELYQVTIDFRRWSPPDQPARHHADEQPLLEDMSVHHFDLLRMILGREPERITCEARNPEWSPFAGPSTAVAAIESGDVLVSYRGSWTSAGPITPWAGEWRLECEHGNVFWASRGDNGALADRVVVRRRGRRPATLPLPEMRVDRWGTLTEFAMAIREEREPQCSGRDNVGTIALVEAAVESATRGVAVDVRARERLST